MLAVPQKRSDSERVHATVPSRQLCFGFAKGDCKRGSNCKFAHGHPDVSSNGGGAGASAHHGGSREAGCVTCGNKITGHKNWKYCPDCYAKKTSAERHSAMTVQQTESTVQVHQASPSNEASIKFDNFCFATTEAHVITVNPERCGQVLATQRGGASGEDFLLMAMDSAATVGVVEDEAQCVHVELVNTTVKVGGDGAPTYVQVRKRGILPIDQLVNGIEVKLNLPVFIIPGFGISVFPFSFLLKRNMRIGIARTTMTVTTPTGGVLMQAKALHHDKESWLFYTKVRLDGGLVETMPDEDSAVTAAQTAMWSASGGNQSTKDLKEDDGISDDGSASTSKTDEGATTTATATATATAGAHYVPVSYALHESEGESEWRQVPFGPERDPALHLSVLNEAGQVMTVSASDPKSLLMLYHRRFGHRNLQDVADMLGLPIPPGMPDCITCKLAKSKRTALTGHGAAVFDPPRVGHTFAWDHAGPFNIPDWDGNTILSLKIDIKSGKIFGRMTKTTGTATSEWIDFVRLLKAQYGRHVVARLITDAAPYFQASELAHFNRVEGIDHTQLPPHTQELNGVPERTLGTIFSMTRAAQLDAVTPERGYGMCMLMMIDTLNAILHKSGGKLTRNEKWHGKLMPDQHKKLGVWGCGAVLHLQHGARGHVGGPGKLPKLDSPGELCALVGYGEFSKKVLRLKFLPKIVIYESAHVTLLENVFPFKAKPERPLSSFLTDEQQRWLDFGGDGAEAIVPSRGRGRPPSGGARSQRSRNPSTRALENIPDVDMSPDLLLTEARARDVHFAATMAPILTMWTPPILRIMASLMKSSPRSGRRLAVRARSAITTS